MRIGIDFDNTIANYDQAFPNVARILGYETKTNNKRDLKAELQALENGDSHWQKVQGLAYGRHISFATLYPGVFEFILRAKSLGVELFIISHKTEFGHFDEQKMPLRDAATSWLIDQNIVGNAKTQIVATNVFFAATRDEKVEKISELNLDVFVDDLEEVLSDRAFPIQTRKILFGSMGDSLGELSWIPSWREISDELFGELDSTSVLFCVQNVWPELKFMAAERIEGRGNSKIFKIESNAGTVALKVYPDRAIDDRPRQDTEWSALSFLRQNKLQVPVPIRINQVVNWSLIEWIEGENANNKASSFIDRAADFIRALTVAGKSLASKDLFANATEACLTPNLIESQIRGRFKSLSEVEDIGLRKFVDQDLAPAFTRVAENASKTLGSSYEAALGESHWALSPSDFGLHNAIVTSSNDLMFFDFEYFGWDDPVKLTSDFCLHPGMSLKIEEQRLWIFEMQKIFGGDSSFLKRLTALYPLYAIRWALIMLNEFRSDKIKNRLHAQSRMQSDIRGAQERQLEKAKLMLKNLESPI